MANRRGKRSRTDSGGIDSSYFGCQYCRHPSKLNPYPPLVSEAHICRYCGQTSSIVCTEYHAVTAARLIYLTLQSFTNVLFYLAANPQYIQPLREEVEPIVHQEGWSKAALGNKRRVDSFLRECQRMEGVNTSMCLHMIRWVSQLIIAR